MSELFCAGDRKVVADPPSYRGRPETVRLIHADDRTVCAHGWPLIGQLPPDEPSRAPASGGDEEEWRTVLALVEQQRDGEIMIEVSALKWAQHHLATAEQRIRDLENRIEYEKDAANVMEGKWNDALARVTVAERAVAEGKVTLDEANRMLHMAAGMDELTHEDFVWLRNLAVRIRAARQTAPVDGTIEGEES